MLTYNRWAPTAAVDETEAHVRAHLSAIASVDDDHNQFAAEVVITREHQHAGVLVHGQLDRDPVAGYLTDDVDPYADVPAELRAEVDR